MKRLKCLVLFGSLFLLNSCDIAKDVASAALCGDGHAKGKMTLGLNSGFFSGIGLTSADGELPGNDTLKSYLNDTLNDTGISPSSFNVSNVESVNDKGQFRFLELGGTFGAGFGIATNLLKKAFSSSSLVGEDAFSFINESFSVGASHFTTSESGNANDQQWALSQTKYQEAVTLVAKIRNAGPDKDNNDPVIVAVLDTGVDGDHPDLKDIMVDGKDFTGDGSGTSDENGHGTHCAGIIAGQAKDADGALGVAASANIKIMPIKVLGKSGGGGFQAIEKGILWAVKNGADVISMSLGAGLEFSDLAKQENPLQNDIVKNAIAAGVIVVIAAGNEACELGGSCKHQQTLYSKEFSEYTVVPCAYDGVICVGASNADETLASYSNFSSDKDSSKYRTKADINAPGTNIYSTWPTNLGQNHKAISGTSMATPFVAGIAALFKWADRSIDQETFLNLIKKSAAQPSDIVDKSGAGRADLYAASVALANDQKLSDAPAESTPEPAPVEDPTDTGSTGNDGDQLTGDLWSAVCQ